jgi:hypothetical protein
MHHRMLVDSGGKVWNVWEVEPQTRDSTDSRRRPSLPDALQAGWLVFECSDERRRSTPLPGEWHVLSDTDLLSLLGNATPTRHRLPRRPEAPSEFKVRLEIARANARNIPTNRGPVRVFELALGENLAPALIFEAADSYWRVRNYPSSWRTLAPEKLFALSSR